MGRWTAAFHPLVIKKRLNVTSVTCICMKLQKTAKGKTELVPGTRTLGQRERTFLLLVDGQRSIKDIAQVLQGDANTLGAMLMLDGYVEEIPGLSTTPLRPLGGERKLAQPVAAMVNSAMSPPTANSVDQFEGKRSLATTRMFLFDISERMFTRKVPELAIHFRDALREAKDRDSMLEVSREMLEEIEKIAGAGRADSISERLAMLLPAAV